MTSKIATFATKLDLNRVIMFGTCVLDDGDENLSASSPWENNRLDERIYADAPNYLTYQLSRKRYSVPYHPAARLRASQQAGVVLPYAMIDRNYEIDDGNRCNNNNNNNRIS